MFTLYYDYTYNRAGSKRAMPVARVCSKFKTEKQLRDFVRYWSLRRGTDSVYGSMRVGNFSLTK